MSDAQAKRNLISNATHLIRASRGRGLIICSESKVGAVGLRGPWDAINLAAVWGLGQERGYEAMCMEPRSAVVTAKMKKTGFRGVIDVVYGGEKPPAVENEGEDKFEKRKRGQKNGPKRKADAVDGPGGDGFTAEQPISKNEARRRAKQTRLNNGAGSSKAAAREETIAVTESFAYAGSTAAAETIAGAESIAPRPGDPE